MWRRIYRKTRSGNHRSRIFSRRLEKSKKKGCQAFGPGSLEHFANPLKALKEMARVSTIQILTVHKKLPIPFSNFLRSFILNLKSVKDQPIDFPISMKELEKILTKAKMHIVFKGVWTHPYDFQMLGFKIPKLLQIPSCHFVITTSP